MRKLLFILAWAFTFNANSQDPARFQEDVEAIKKRYDAILDNSKETIVFTGSSSIRIWNDLQERFPQYRVVNTGFGGSQASDLLYHSYNLVLRFNPDKVFIYEGDNDLSAKKKPSQILSTIAQIISGIHKNKPDTEVILIAAKPSIARWGLKRKYKRLNRKFAKMASKDSLVQFADVWDPMLDGRKVKQDIFIEDGLHMNAKGYEIWFGVMKAFLN